MGVEPGEKRIKDFGLWLDEPMDLDEFFGTPPPYPIMLTKAKSAILKLCAAAKGKMLKKVA